MIKEMIINPSSTRAARLPTSSYNDTIPDQHRDAPAMPPPGEAFTGDGAA